MADDPIGEGVEALSGAVKEFTERRRKRQASMKLGGELVKPDVLESISDPGFRKTLQAVGSQMATGDLFLDDAVKFLNVVPEPAETLDPVVADYLRREMGIGAPTSAAAPETPQATPVSTEASPTGEAEVPSDVENRIGPYTETINLPLGKRGGLGLRVPPPENVLARERTEKVKTATAEETAKQKLQPLTQEAGIVETSAYTAVTAIDNLLRIAQQNPGIIQKSKVPGAAVVGPDIIQEVDFWLKKLKLEASTSRGGKNLTETEQKIVKEVLPLLLRGDYRNLLSLRELRSGFERTRKQILGPVRYNDPFFNPPPEAYQSPSQQRQGQAAPAKAQTGFRVIRRLD